MSDFAPRPDPDRRDLFGFRTSADGGSAYMTVEDLTQLTAARPPMTEAELMAEVGAVQTLCGRNVSGLVSSTEEQLDALGRLRATGMLDDAQAEHTIRDIFGAHLRPDGGSPIPRWAPCSVPLRCRWDAACSPVMRVQRQATGMSVLAAIARALIRRLPEQERAAISLELIEQANDSDTDLADLDHADPDHDGPDDDGPDATAPDWDYVWNALITASNHAHRVQMLLSDKRVFFDLADATTLADQLRTLINTAYALSCTAPRLPGFHLAAGTDLDTVRHLVDVRRAEIVDAELATMRRPPAADAPSWSIDYRRGGGFIATSPPGDGTTPQMIWGSAATSHSAEHLLNWYFHDQPPATVFDPPQPDTPWPLTTIGPESDLSADAPWLHDLLDQRGPIYDQHIVACRSARAQLTSRPEARHYLDQRAAELNATEHQLRDHDALDSTGLPDNHDHSGYAHALQWVLTSLVVATDHPTWGEFSGHRDETPYTIAEGLRRSSDLDAFTYKLFTDEINLLRVPAWAGPLYRIGANGNHRIHTARMLNLPWLAASVDVETIAPSWDMLGLIVEDPHRDEDRHRLDERLRERAALIAGLIRRGIIDGDLTDEGTRSTLHCRYLPAAWLLRAPQDTTRINAVYESRYPGALAQLGIPAAVGTDPVVWARWLTTP